MGLFSDFFNRKAIDVQAEKFAAQFLERLPLQHVKDNKRFSKEYEIIFGHLQGFHRTAKLGVFGKARLVNSFQWSLVARGYEEDLARKIGKDIATRLTGSTIQTS